MEIGGVKVDINPITEGKTGTLEEYLLGVEAYLQEKENEKSKRKTVKEKIMEKKEKSLNGSRKIKEKKKDNFR